jgi:hypothetical protein
MERLNDMKKYSIICFIIVTVIFFTGCGKKFWDYKGVWISEKPYVYLPIRHDNIILEVKENEKITVKAAWDNTGERIFFYIFDDDKSEDISIWVADVKLKKDKLYLTIIEDHYGENEGKEIVLEQQPVQE